MCSCSRKDDREIQHYFDSKDNMIPSISYYESIISELVLGLLQIISRKCSLTEVKSLTSLFKLIASLLYIWNKRRSEMEDVDRITNID